MAGRTVLVYEFVTGGGLVGRDLPASWAAEGGAMRRAIAADFAAVPGVRVLVPLDSRLAPEADPPGVATRIIADRPFGAFEALAREADLILAIAPETGGLLGDHARRLRDLGARSLGSEPEGIDIAADKARLAAIFKAQGIPTPPTRTFVPALGLPADLAGPIVVKPVDGAGSLDTFIVREPHVCPPGLPPLAIAQPFCPGDPRSASFLLDRGGRPSLLAVGRQRIEVDGAGRVTYLGGTIPADPGDDLATIESALACVPGLRGFVGVDFLHMEAGPIVLEINPRPTTSFVGLARWLGPGMIAAAWLAGLEGGKIPPFAPIGPSVTFGADGSTHAGTSST